ncbi:hypothetical protein ACSS6W_008568 [Trichoderma asperelloides]
MRHHATTAGLLGSGYSALLVLQACSVYLLLPRTALSISGHRDSDMVWHLKKALACAKCDSLSFNFSFAFVLGPPSSHLKYIWDIKLALCPLVRCSTTAFEPGDLESSDCCVATAA